MGDDRLTFRDDLVRAPRNSLVCDVEDDVLDVLTSIFKIMSEDKG